MHILYAVSGWNDAGGGAILPRATALALANRGLKISVLNAQCGSGGGSSPQVKKSMEGGVRIVTVSNLPDFLWNLSHPERDADDPAMRGLCLRLIGDLAPDLIHWHSLFNFSMGLALESRRAGVPAVFTGHDYRLLCPRVYLFRGDLSVCDGPSHDGWKCAKCLDAPGREQIYALRAAMSRALSREAFDLHLTVSGRAGRIFARNGHDPRRMRTLHPQTPTIDLLWKRLGSGRRPASLSGRPLRVGFIGNLLAWKGVHVLVRALQGFDPRRVEGHLFGSGPESYASALRALDRKGILRFHGRYGHGDLPGILGGIDVVVAPSLCEETGGLTVLEALAGRVPVVGSRIGGFTEFIEEGETGFLFPPGDADALAEILSRFLSDPLLLERLQNRIRPPVGLYAYLDALEAHYRGVLSGCR